MLLIIVVIIIGACLHGLAVVVALSPNRRCVDMMVDQSYEAIGVWRFLKWKCVRLESEGQPPTAQLQSQGCRRLLDWRIANYYFGEL